MLNSNVYIEEKKRQDYYESQAQAAERKRKLEEIAKVDAERKRHRYKKSACYFGRIPDIHRLRSDFSLKAVFSPLLQARPHTLGARSGRDVGDIARLFPGHRHIRSALVPGAVS